MNINKKVFGKIYSNRRLARERALQILYSWEISNYDIKDIEVNFVIDQNMNNVNIFYFQKLYIGVTNHTQELDELMSPYLSRKINQLGCIERIILRIALFELSECLDVPYKVIINEAIELAKIFGAEKSHKFVNGVLDKVALQIRTNSK
ncbi:transcription antitermination factor NusB [Blochmannia endosymbiont of Colobopsis nipponica]|uniref:transcription antitermination factor NusB n=1 Tax=Blochmannia endosymbiont of Colobopsis nipponica TaxID=2681987 RepID=UPI00177EE9FB|nr:transcription antitermination factor NusB [Blochmannia endosymbiont of Colobopsis nipponica]QOI11189.1 transcription antitermination factor NusB [Blochmannia endosymbiont of Colobopsis nipponica]